MKESPRPLMLWNSRNGTPMCGSSASTQLAVRELRAERMIRGSDVGGRSFASQLSNVLGASLPDSAKALILGGNLRRLLTPVPRAKGLHD